MPTIEVTPGILVDRSEFAFSFARAGGPGGQNVNKVETAGQLRFDVAESPCLDDTVKRRLKRLARARLTTEGKLLISQSFIIACSIDSSLFLRSGFNLQLFSSTLQSQRGADSGDD
ncbi:MAG: hypothetical protein ACREDV_12105 [Methylocella sp.]